MISFQKKTINCLLKMALCFGIVSVLLAVDDKQNTVAFADDFSERITAKKSVDSLDRGTIDGSSTFPEISADGFPTYVFDINEDLGSKNTTLEIPVNAGTNYRIKVVFTAKETGFNKDSDKPVNIYFDEVIADECIANIQPAYVAQGVLDRSSLMYEFPTVGADDVREFTVASYKDSLKLIISGEAYLKSVSITELKRLAEGNKRTVHIIGDSLVQTYTQSYYPMTGWGQMLPTFFTNDLEFVNHALGGRSTGTFIKEGRLNAVLASVKPGDYVLITFGHNDASTVKGRFVSVPNYKDNLINKYAAGVIQRGGIPVFVTLGNQNIVMRDMTIGQSYPEYVNAMKEAAVEAGVALIDLNQLSRDAFYEIVSKYGRFALSEIVFNHFQAGVFKETIGGAGDTTHFQKNGATLLARLIAEDIKKQGFEGVAEYYVPYVPQTSLPCKVSNLVYNDTDFDITYYHLDWDAAEGAEFYDVQKAVSVGEDGNLVFEHYVYSAVNMVADPKRDTSLPAAYRVFSMNSVGTSTEASNVLILLSENGEGFPEVDVDLNDKDNRFIDLTGLLSPDNEDETVTQNWSQEEERKKTSFKIKVFVTGILLAVIACTASFLIFRKKRDGE